MKITSCSTVLALVFCLQSPVMLGQKVGINNTQPIGWLSLPPGHGKKISFWGDAAGSHYGMATNNAFEWQIFSDASFTHTVFGTGSSNSFTEFMRITESGVGLGIPNPQYPLDVLGRIRISTYIDRLFNLNTQQWYDVYRPAYLLLNAQNNSGVLARIGMNNGNFGFYRHSDNRLLFGINVYGALVVNGTTGNAGQVLKSNGFTQAPSWENDVVMDMFANQHLGYQSSIVQLTDPGSFGTISFTTSFPIFGSEDPLIVGVNAPTKVLVKYELIGTATCCGPAYMQVNVMDNNQPKRSLRYTITGGQTETLSGVALLDLSQGNHSIALQVIKISGSNVSFNIDNNQKTGSMLTVSRINGKSF